MSGKMEPSTYLFDVPPLLMNTFCKVMDSGFDSLGWRGLAARIVPSWLEVRCSEMYAAAGKSPTHELLWSWAQQNKTVGDLMRVLEDMGHYRALELFRSQDSYKGVPHSSSVQNISKPQPHNEVPSKDSELNHECVSGEGNTKARITYSEVKVGTRNFHQDLKIGESTFAEVYKGKRGNESFAVKVFKQGNKSTWKSLWEKFKTEFEVLQFSDHPNILQLWGSFSDDEGYCLVYPFMPNGSLFHKLHDGESERTLTWQERLNIIKGTAKAVHHLHNAQPCMVICGNITSSNILLDEHLQPKLSDLGMARLRPHTVNQSLTITMDTGPRRNLAYLPEEYIRDGKLSVKLDIYSLGMVILETCTGKKVMQETPKQSLLRDVLSLEVEEKGSVDACLRFLDSRAGAWPTAAALCLLRLGLECTSSRARARPCMNNVLEKLSELEDLPFALDDCPRTLADMTPPSKPLTDRLSSGLPGMDDKPKLPEQSEPQECSQSEVIFVGKKEHDVCLDSSSLMNGRRENASVQFLQTDCTPALDLYSSWPVECSCAAGAETGCEDCWANGFSHNPSLIPQDGRIHPSEAITENPAKTRLRNKIQLYNQGLLNTEELLSMTSD